ncbi:glycosyl hydrolase family 18 protein [Actinoplanes sp. KI2]|uniref:glycosyl hydrolase family 18 protein n=1 Tax=Actinoplanes sp. KI2 TaxID=2983315 RepID=UPI0021D58A5F|nr:glycosyl hydrolase family 18 protein [Actinoplanes sp. KI2]MCU7725399.1 glycosyl hydrolase family 18 protein [Actinoplanes sp. KI2]
MSKRVRAKTAKFGSLALAGVVAVGVGLVALPADAAVSSPVLAYQFEGDATSLIAASAGAIEQVGVDGVNITSDGTGVGRPDADATSQLAAAHSLGKKAEVLIGNFSESLGDFDEPAAYRMLSSTAHIKAIVNTMKSAVNSQGWDGVDIDLEALQARDTSGLLTFIKTLKAALPGKTVSIAITCYTTEQEFTNAGYDLSALGKAVDRLVLMAYDQHGFGDSGPGPVGALSWQTTGLGIVLRHMGGDNGKVILGEAGYGYRWYTDWRSGHVDQVSDAQARSLAGSRAVWDGTAHEWHATLADGSILWWADAKSLADRQSLVSDRGLHGLAVWDLGLSDPITRS